MREGKEIGALWKPGRGGIGVLQDERGFDTPGFVVECIPCVGCGNVGHWKSRMGRRVQGTRGGAGWWRVADMQADFPIVQDAELLSVDYLWLLLLLLLRRIVTPPEAP